MAIEFIKKDNILKDDSNQNEDNVLNMASLLKSDYFEIDISNYNIEKTKKTIKDVLTKEPFVLKQLKGELYYNSKYDLEDYIALNRFVGEEYGRAIAKRPSFYASTPPISTQKKEESLRPNVLCNSSRPRVLFDAAPNKETRKEDRSLSKRDLYRRMRLNEDKQSIDDDYGLEEQDDTFVKSKKKERINADVLYSRLILEEKHSLIPEDDYCFDFEIEDTGFSEELIKLIDEKGLKDSDVYKNANIDRKLFSKIKNDKYYIPKKTTVLAFCIGLKLSLYETEALLKKAGYSLSKAIKGDLIVEYYIRKKVYDIMLINEALYDHDQQLLGSKA